MLLLLCVVCTWSYYRLSYHQTVFAEDRFSQTFWGFYKIEGDAPRTYRWTDGHGTLCMPSAGQGQPPLALQLDLLGQSEDLQIREFVARVGATDLLVPLREHDGRYRLLLPASTTSDPICVELISSARMPDGDERLLGVGLRALQLDWLAGAPPLVPPLHQLAINIGLVLGSYELLRRLHLYKWLSTALVSVIVIGATVLLMSGRVRFTPDLPLMTAGTLAGVTLILTTTTLRSSLTSRTMNPWLCEGITIGLTLLMLLAAMFGFQALAGYDPGSYPLMARMGPTFSVDVLWSIAVFGLWMVLLWRWLSAEQPPSPLLAISVSWLAAFGIIVLLKAGLREANSLFQTFTWQPEDYIRDVRRVGDDPIGFLRDYVEMMPRLARHNRTHPPGSTLFLWAIAQTLGSGPKIATWIVIALGTLGVWPTYLLARWAASSLGSPRRDRLALIAAAIYGLLPAQLIFGATSMDAVFATVLAAATYCLARALLDDQNEGRSRLYAIFAGLWLAIGLVLVFTTLVLGLFVVAIACWLLLQRPTLDTIRRLVIQGALVGGTTLLLLAGVWATTGYNSWEAFREGSANNVIDVQERTPPASPATYLFFLSANLVAWGIYLGPWGTSLLAQGGAQGITALRLTDQRNKCETTRVDAILAGTVVLVSGLFVSGLFVREVERILLFTHILVAFAMAHGIMKQQSSISYRFLTIVMVSTLFLQALVMRALLRIYW